MAKTKKNKNTDKIESNINDVIKEVIEIDGIEQQDLLEDKTDEIIEDVNKDDDIEKASQLLQQKIIEQSKILIKNSVDLNDVEETDPNKNSFEKKLSDEIKKQSPGLYAQLVVVARGMQYILIKAKNNIYCYARFVKSQRTSESSPEWELEFLANIPSAIHKDILSITHACGTHDSRRVFFNPSGMI